MIGIIYSLFYIITIFALFLSGKYISNGKIVFWKAALIGIIPYSLNEGLRFGRGIDYNIYYNVYNDIINGLETRSEPLFVLFVKFFGWLGLEWQYFVFFVSFVFIIAVYFYMSRYKGYAKYALPIVPILTIWSENIMRQTLAYSFLIVALYFFFSKKRNSILAIVFAISSVLIHGAMVLLIPLFYIVSKKKDFLLNPYISLSLFIVFAFVGNLGLVDVIFKVGFDFVTNYIPSLAYLDYDRFEDGGAAEHKLLSVSKTTFLMALIFYGAKNGNNSCSRSYTYTYNVFLIGALMFPLFNNNELINRIGEVLLLFGTVVFSYSVLNVKLKLKFNIGTVLLFVLMLNMIRTYITPAYKAPYCYQYVWNKGVSPVLDVVEYKYQLSKK